MRPLTILLLIAFPILARSENPDILYLPHLLDDPSQDERRHQIVVLAEKYRTTPDKEFSTAVLASLVRSPGPEYSRRERASITELAGRLDDPKMIPFLIEHVTDTGPASQPPGLSIGLPVGLPSPYATALCFYPKHTLGPLLDAMEKSKNPEFDRAVASTIDGMGYITFLLIERCKTIKPNSKVFDFVAQRLKDSPQIIELIDDAIAAETKRSNKKNLVQMKKKIAGSLNP